jgi:hypothetical protein
MSRFWQWLRSLWRSRKSFHYRIDDDDKPPGEWRWWG